jgi:hypothetical protein
VRAEQSFKTIAQSVALWFGAQINTEPSEIEIELEEKGRLVRILPNPKDDKLIIIEAVLSPSETDGLLTDLDRLVFLHQINENAIAIQDWRFCIEANETTLVRANFYSQDLLIENAVERTVSDANNFIDVLVLSAELAKTRSAEKQKPDSSKMTEANLIDIRMARA